MKLRSWMLAAVYLAASGAIHAQELRCTQIFMNASEKRICATPELMQLDEQIGELGRRVMPYQDTFKADQRRFRKALKTCNGDEACLTSSYQVRISELQAFVNTLPAPTDAEATGLAAQAQEAEQKRNAQEQTRERIADKLEATDAAAQPVEDTPMEQPEGIQAPVDPMPIGEVGQPVAEPAEQVVEAQPEGTSDRPSWWVIGLIVLMVIGAIGMFVDWLFKAVRRCPKCTKWWAGEIFDQDREAYTDYETKTFTDTHWDKNFNRTGSTTRKRQVAVRVSNTTNYLRCRLCKHEWTIHHSRRSS